MDPREEKVVQEEMENIVKKQSCHIKTDPEEKNKSNWQMSMINRIVYQIILRSVSHLS